MFAQRSVTFDFSFGKFLRTDAFSLIQERLHPVSSMACIPEPCIYILTNKSGVEVEGDLPFGQTTNTGLSCGLTEGISLLAARSHFDGKALSTTSLNHSGVSCL